MIETYRPLPGDLRIYRLIYAAYLICAVVPVAPWFADAPLAFFRPPIGLAAIWTRPIPPAAMFALNVLLSVFAAMLLAGWRVRLASIGAGVTLFLLKTWAYSLGKINHDILIVVVPFVFATSWGDDDEPDPLPLAVFALLIGFAMALAGYEKASTGWLDPQLRCTYGHLVGSCVLSCRETFLARYAITIDSGILWKLADYLTVLLECGFLPAALNRRWFAVALFCAVFFHLGIDLLMSINFGWNGSVTQHSSLGPGSFRDSNRDGRRRSLVERSDSRRSPPAGVWRISCRGVW
jgi:hypothetical protein